MPCVLSSRESSQWSMTMVELVAAGSEQGGCLLSSCKGESAWWKQQQAKKSVGCWEERGLFQRSSLLACLWRRRRMKQMLSKVFRGQIQPFETKTATSTNNKKWMDEDWWWMMNSIESRIIGTRDWLQIDSRNRSSLSELAREDTVPFRSY